MKEPAKPNQPHFGQVLLIESAIAWSWLAMQAVHEFGHVMHAWTSGGKVVRVVLHPLVISRTDVDPNPHPQFVAWGGPIWGSLIPVALFACVRTAGWPRTWLARFFAGFCLVANGAYLLGGSAYPVGDAEVLLREGASLFALAVFGLVALGAGLMLWNKLGPHFGFGKTAKPVDVKAAWWVAVAATALAITECLVGGGIGT